MFVILNDICFLTVDKATEGLEWTLVADYCADIDNLPDDKTIMNLANKLSSYEDYCWFYFMNESEDGLQVIGLTDDLIEDAVSSYRPDYNPVSDTSTSGLRLLAGTTIKSNGSSNVFWIFDYGSHEPITLNDIELYPAGAVTALYGEIPYDAIIVNQTNFKQFEKGKISVHCIFKKQMSPLDEEIFSKYLKESLCSSNNRVDVPYAFRIPVAEANVGHTRAYVSFIICLALIGSIAAFFYGTMDFKKYMKICYNCGMTRMGCRIAYLLLFLIYLVLGLLFQLPIGYLMTR